MIVIVGLGRETDCDCKVDHCWRLLCIKIQLIPASPDGLLAADLGTQCDTQNGDNIVTAELALCQRWKACEERLTSENFLGVFLGGSSRNVGGLGGAFTSSLFSSAAPLSSSDALPAGIGLGLSPAAGSEDEDTSHAIYSYMCSVVDFLVCCLLLKSSRDSSCSFVDLLVCCLLLKSSRGSSSPWVCNR